MSTTKTKLLNKETDKLLNLLEARFEHNMHRHQHLEWTSIAKKLIANPIKLKALLAMEDTGGEPDVIDFDKENNQYVFVDCAAESPKGRRSICYDKEALEARKKFPPKNSAKHMAETMGIELLTEAQYRKLQTLGNFDMKTSSWLETPQNIRKLGGAIFGDFRFDTVFIYHNGAESYYAARGFRGCLKV